MSKFARLCGLFYEKLILHVKQCLFTAAHCVVYLMRTLTDDAVYSSKSYLMLYEREY